jgi:hypothetical protein
MNSEKLVTLEVNSIHPTTLKEANTIQKKLNELLFYLSAAC